MKLIRAVKNIYKTLKFLFEVDSKRHKNIINIFDQLYGNKLSNDLISSVDSKGNPIPWFTYPALEYLKQLNFKDFKILEWGSGNSTQYFSSRAKQVYSLEHDKNWYEENLKYISPNVKLNLLTTKEDYCNFPLQLDLKFDLIVIDGVYRDECLDTAFKVLSNNGIIILDNSERYPELCQKIRDLSFLEIDFHGFGPINSYTWTTSLFFKELINPPTLNIQPQIPLGGGF